MPHLWAYCIFYSSRCHTRNGSPPISPVHLHLSIIVWVNQLYAWQSNCLVFIIKRFMKLPLFLVEAVFVTQCKCTQYYSLFVLLAHLCVFPITSLYMQCYTHRYRHGGVCMVDTQSVSAQRWPWWTPCSVIRSSYAKLKFLRKLPSPFKPLLRKSNCLCV